MPFNRPSLPDLVAEAESNIASRLPGADSRLKRSALSVLARVQAGLAHGIYGFVAWVFLQVLPHTASEEYLYRHARNVRRKAAAYAKGQAQARGASGALIAAGTKFKSDAGQEYASQSDCRLGQAGAGLVSLEALSPGAASNAAPGAKLSLVSPVAGVDGSLTVAAAGISGGTDEESADSWRQRILERWQKPPRGGSKTDYETWAKEVPGITRAWCYPEWLGLGTVGVVVLSDDAPADTGGPVPDATTLARVEAYLKDSRRRPVTCHDIYVIAPTLKPLDLVISGLTPNAAEVRASVAAELEDLLRREAEPGGELLISHIRAAISTAAGEWDHTLVEPIYNVVHRPHELPVLGTITWV